MYHDRDYQLQRLHKELAACQFLATFGLTTALLDAPAERVLLHIPEQQAVNIMFVQNDMPNKKLPKQKWYYQNNKNNNRVDRSRHAQINMQVKQPKQRNQKRLIKSYQRF